MAATKQDPKPFANPEGKTVDEIVEICKVIQMQVNDSHLKYSQYNSLASTEKEKNTKARGALEVLIQMIPNEQAEEFVEKVNESEDKEEK